MAHVELTRHLRRFFPELTSDPIEIEASSVAELLSRLDERYPRMRHYLAEETGQLRKHVTIYVDGEQLIPREAMACALNSNSRVYISQALSGG